MQRTCNMAAALLKRSLTHRRHFATSSSSSSAASRPPRGVSRAPRVLPFVPPSSPVSAAGFLAELKSFAGRHPRVPAEELSSLLPLSFSGDASLILSGARRVVTSSDEFQFGCTGCGGCCRTYPNDVMLDPHDVFLISRAGGADAGGLDSTTALHAKYPKAFQTHLGIWERGEKLVEEKRGGAGGSGAELASMHKLAPVMFLRTKRVKQTSKATGVSRVEERCWFSYPAEKNSVQLTEEAESTSTTTDTATPGLVRPPARQPPPSGPTAPTAGLRCRLGPANQPTACTLYPLGELYSNRSAAPTTAASSNSASLPVAPAAAAKYYTLDVTNCEGTRAVPSATTTTTVAGYEARNGLVGRRAEWEWFERTVAQPTASKGWMSLQPHTRLERTLNEEFRNRLMQVLLDVWFDFDSLECTPVAAPSSSAGAATSPRRFPDWPSARAAISTATQHIMDSTETYMQECNLSGTEPDAIKQRDQAEARWLNRLREGGVLKRELARLQSVKA